MTIFDDATAVRRRAEGRYDARPDPRFALGPSPSAAVNGGALLATVLRAVLAESPHPHPVATSAHFLRVARLEPAEVQVAWLKQGKTTATARAALVQDGQPVLDVTVTTGTVPISPAGDQLARADRAEDLSWTGPPPDIPPIEDCLDLGHWPTAASVGGPAQGYASQVSVLMDPATTGWRSHQPSGLPEMRGYFGLREPRDPDAYLLALAVDGLPPVVFGLGASGWAPTVELTWYMRAVPGPGPLRVAARCRHVGGGWFDEETEIWDHAGGLVAQSRQLARVGRGPLRPIAGPPPPAGP